jgi:hypothetical protein
MRAIQRPDTDPELIFRVVAVFQDNKRLMATLLDDVSTEADEAVR